MKVLFICHANICRSFVAEQLLKKYLPGCTVFSRGLYADDSYIVPQKVWDFLIAKQIAPTDHQSTLLTKDDLHQADYIFLMEQAHADMLLDRYAQYTDKIFLLNDFVFDKTQDIQDPIGLSGRAFKKQMDVLDKTIYACAEKLKQEMLWKELF